LVASYSLNDRTFVSSVQTDRRRVLVDAEIEMIVAFVEIERVDADEPVAAPARDRAGLRQHAHLLLVRCAFRDRWS
jgi:hypothetical protein